MRQPIPRAPSGATGLRVLRLGIAVASCAAIAAAQRTDPPRRSVNWDRARAEVARYRATLDNSGLVDVDAYISPRVDAEDLQALCQARRDAEGVARTAAQNSLLA
jgi:hypothetical protein